MQIKLKKFSASGNTFYLLDASKLSLRHDLNKLAKRLCNKNGSEGADGLLVLEDSQKANTKMRIFNADGSEAQMCGNGARCVAFYLKSNITIETIAGLIPAQAYRSRVKIELTAPKDIEINMPLEVNGRRIHVSFIDTGVPHIVVFVNTLKRIDVNVIGASLRNHEKFSPRGTNVNFVEITGPDSLSVRTYERGVEGETLACGTGIAASALVSFRLSFIRSKNIKVKPASGDTLMVRFDYEDYKFAGVWLEGRVKKLTGKIINII